MPELQAITVSNDGVQYLGKITSISTPDVDDDGTITYTVTSDTFGDDNGLHTFHDTNYFEPTA